MHSAFPLLEAPPSSHLGLDNLSAPCGVIHQAQQLAAEAFGADRTWFLVNGCSSGIHAGVMACAGPGATLLVARNCHLSVFSAMIMSGEAGTTLVTKCAASGLHSPPTGSLGLRIRSLAPHLNDHTCRVLSILLLLTWVPVPAG